jgi:hypothetical protein
MDSVFRQMWNQDFGTGEQNTPAQAQEARKSGHALLSFLSPREKICLELKDDGGRKGSECQFDPRQFSIQSMRRC